MAIQDDRTRADLTRMLEKIRDGDEDEDRWGESPAAQAAQEALGASTPTFGFIE